VKYSFVSSLFGVSIDKFILLATWFLILQILTFYDMLHSLLFNFYTNIQTWMSTLFELKLKYRFFDKNNINNYGAILHYLIHILRMFFVFYCSILILSLLIYCFKAPIILLQRLSQRSPQFS
jgi:hypothetical protein